MTDEVAEITSLPAVRVGQLAHTERHEVDVGSKRSVTVTHRGTGEKFALRPQGDRIIVQPIKEGSDRRYGQLYLPDNAVEQPTIGRVLAAGDGRWEQGQFIATTVVPGDVVVFGKHAGTEAEIWGTEVLFLRAGDIMAVCDDIGLDEER